MLYTILGVFALFSLARAHFTLDYPYTRGFNEVRIVLYCLTLSMKALNLPAFGCCRTRNLLLPVVSLVHASHCRERIRHSLSYFRWIRCEQDANAFPSKRGLHFVHESSPERSWSVFFHLCIRPPLLFPDILNVE